MIGNLAAPLGLPQRRDLIDLPPQIPLITLLACGEVQSSSPSARPIGHRCPIGSRYGLDAE